MASSSTPSTSYFPEQPHLQHTMIVANFVSSKLSRAKNSNNYGSWKVQMVCLIESQGLLDYVDGKVQPPSEERGDSSDAIVSGQNYVRSSDRLVKGWILGALDDDVLDKVYKLDTTREVWLELEKMFEVSHNPPGPSSIEKCGNQYLPLQRAARRGDWEAANSILFPDAVGDKTMVSFCMRLAVRTGEPATDLLRNIVELLTEDELATLTNISGNTGLHIAATVGNTEAAKILVARRRSLLQIPNEAGDLPVHEAALETQRETLVYLIGEDEDKEDPYPGLQGVKLVIYAIQAEFFDTALSLVNKYPDSATHTLENGESALGVIAARKLTFSIGRCSNFWQRVIATLRFFCQNLPEVDRPNITKAKNWQALKLVKCLCKKLESLSYNEASKIWGDAIIRAAKSGNHEVVQEIVETFPDAIFAHSSGKNIFHLAVENRCEDVFNLIHQMGDHNQHTFFSPLDMDGNNLLHSAGKLAPSPKLSNISGAALQMQREMQWFKEVEKLIHSYSRERLNKDGKSPYMVLAEEHRELKKDGEKWMKGTAYSCTFVAALIASIMFAAAITVPGGDDNITGIPIFKRRSTFAIFAIADAVSLFTSTTSLLMFLAILTSRYAEEDFLYALPTRLIIGLTSLFLSITSMMVAFTAIILLVFGQNKTWVLGPVAILAFFPVASFIFLQFPLLLDLILSTYSPGIFGKKSNRPFG